MNRALLAAALFFGLAPPSAAQSAGKQLSFDLPAERAADSFRQFAGQSGVSLLYAPDELAGVETNAVRGTFTADEAIDRLLAGTPLVAVHGRGGAIGITRAAHPEARGLAVPAPAGSAPKEEETILLNPFEVEADSSRSYAALNSNSIAAFNVALAHMPVTADILDQAFMSDVGAVNVEAAIQAFDAGAEFGAINASNAAENQPGDHLANGSLRLRGSPIGGMQLNGLLIAGSIGDPGGTSFGSTSTFSLERIEIFDGPQSLLFVGGGAGGVINLVTKQARIGAPAFGSLGFRVDQYGSKYATFDYGAGAGPLAVRIALVDGTLDSRRVNIGERLKGAYLQVAAQAGNTLLRLSLSQSVDSRIDQDYHTLSSSAGDSQFFSDNGDHLEYLLATGAAGAIDNGRLNWDNVESFDGEWSADHEVAEFASLSAESKWTDWLSTEVSVAAGNFDDDQAGAGSTVNFYTPASNANPIPGSWTIAMPQSGVPASDEWRPRRNRAIRGNVLLTGELFGGRAKSRTNLVADYTGNYNAIVPYGYYQADANGNTIVNPALATATDPGRTPIPTQAWTVDAGPGLDSLFNPGAPRVILNGVTYLREKQNLAPGAAGSGANGTFDAGYALVNDTQWLDGRLDTLAGVRWTHLKTYIAGMPADEVKAPDFSLGADYRLLPWLAPYANISDVRSTAPSANPEPNGALPGISRSAGEEAGLKIGGDAGAVSGSISFYRNAAANEEFDGGAGLGAYIAPNGLNGKPVSGPDFTSKVTTWGGTVAMTASPSPSWRMRLSAAETVGRFGNDAAFAPLYDDQFHENPAGQVTYADGTVVCVPAEFNSRQLTVPAGTPGSVPLTVALLSTPNGPYYASPQPVSGAILKSSNGGQVLLSPPDPVHGSIRTGALGLPISAYQLLPSLSGVAPQSPLYAVLPGDRTWGYPRYSVNLTAVYESPSGWAKGAKIGGTFAVNWDDLAKYFYPGGFNGANFSDQRAFYRPTLARFDLIVGYEHKFGRLSFSTQLNIFNLLNQYKVLIYPDVATGWTNPANLTASFDQQPRSCVWTNTIGF